MMHKEAKSNNGIKDIVSKLFILRDSCRGTCITQIDNPNIIWYEGASVLLQQVIERMKSTRHITDSGDKEAVKDFCHNVKETISKLIVLKRSWIVTRSEESDENATWFEGAESILFEVIDQLQKAIQETEPQTTVAAEKNQSEVTAPAKDSEPVAAAEKNNPTDDTPVKEKNNPQASGSKTDAEKENAPDTDAQVKQNS